MIQGSGGNGNGDTVDRGPGGRWAKGQSGNPAGRKPKHRYVSELIRDRLTELKPGDDQERTWAEFLADKALLDAAAGKGEEVHRLLDRIEGRPRQAITLATEKPAQHADLGKLSTDQLHTYRELIEATGVVDEDTGDSHGEEG